MGLQIHELCTVIDATIALKILKLQDTAINTNAHKGELAAWECIKMALNTFDLFSVVENDVFMNVDTTDQVKLLAGNITTFAIGQISRLNGIQPCVEYYKGFRQGCEEYEIVVQRLAYPEGR